MIYFFTKNYSLHDALHKKSNIFLCFNVLNLNVFLLLLCLSSFYKIKCLFHIVTFYAIGIYQ